MQLGWHLRFLLLATSYLSRLVRQETTSEYTIPAPTLTCILSRSIKNLPIVAQYFVFSVIKGVSAVTVLLVMELYVLLFSDFPQHASSTPYFWPPDAFAVKHKKEGIHLIICVHGLDGKC